jgi:hypothetical protein
VAKPAVIGLLKRAFRAVGFPDASPAELMPFLRSNIGRSDWGLFVGFEPFDQRSGGDPKAVALAMLPSTPLMLKPQIVLAYNEGSKALARMIGVRVRAWILEAGYADALAINLHHKARSFARVFRHFGEPSSFAEVVRFSLEG